MISSRRLALVSIVFLFGAAACGDPSSTSSTSPAVTTAANKPPVIHLASGSGGAIGGPAAAPAAAESTADSKMAIMAPTEFVYDGDLPALDGPAASWYFAPGQQPDPERISQLAASLGVTGELRTVPADQGGGWAIGPEDYSGPVLTVGSDGLLSWWLSSAVPVTAPCAVAGAEPATGDGGTGAEPATGDGGTGAEPATGEGVAGSSGTAGPDVVVVPDTAAPADGVVPECATPEPPVNVPTKDEALAKAKDVFAAWGYDVTAYEFDEPYADEWSASVNAWLTVDGMRAPITLSVGFGENGTIMWASGSLATPQRGADYPTVGAAAGLERLKEQQNQYTTFADTAVMKGATEEATAGTAVLVDEPVASGAATPDIAIAPCPTGPAVDCGPVDVEPVTVTLNSVKRDLTMVWDADGTVWLLPAYAFGSADGGTYTVLAVDDAYIQQPDPGIAETVPADVPANVPSTEVAATEVATTVVVGTSPVAP